MCVARLGNDTLGMHFIYKYSVEYQIRSASSSRRGRDTVVRMGMFVFLIHIMYSKLLIRNNQN